MKNNSIILLLCSGIFMFFQNDDHLNKSENHYIINLAETKQTEIKTPPADLNLDPFYKKYIDANGFPVISSWRVPGEALIKAHDIIVYMTENLPQNVVDKMREVGVRIGVMARYEGTTDIPEHKHLVNDTSINWDVRARGLGGTIEDPLTTCAEENLLCYQIDKYHAEDILIHEFGHTIHLVGILGTDSTINGRLQESLDKAISEGKWDNTYAATNIAEYWAEGVQSWFNVNAEVPEPDGKHNFVNTRDELKVYDPSLYAILKEYLPETKDCISCHSIPFSTEKSDEKD
jgi:hypothetical protein